MSCHPPPPHTHTIMTQQAYMDRLWSDIVRFASKKETEWMAKAIINDYDAKIELGWPHAKENTYHGN